MAWIQRVRTRLGWKRIDGRYAGARAIAFLDTNIILEGRPLAELPWAEVDPAGPILVLFTPKVLSEIDSKKTHGRLGEVARAFNRQIGLLASEKHSELPLLDGPPRVSLGLVASSRIPWSRYDDLDPEDSDSRVVAEILHAIGVPADKRFFVSHDLKPIATAARNGLRTIHVSDAWIRPRESSKAEKEAARLKEEIAELRKNEPKLELSIKPLVDSPVCIYRVRPLTVAERDGLTASILARNPKPRVRGLEHIITTDYTLSTRWETYESKKVPAFAAEFHRKLEVQFCQIPIEITVSNVGAVRADNLVLHVVVLSGWLNDKPIMVPFGGPLAPRERSPMIDMMRGRYAGTLLHKPGKHEMHVEVEPRRGTRMEVHCEDFRHDRLWKFKGVLWLDPNSQDDTVISVTATAANMHGKRTSHSKVAKAILDVSWDELVDPSARGLKRPHIQDWFEKAVSSNDDDEFEMDDADD